ncbi:MAG: prenyltransferase/squalene oxidase repeat-containing protein [Planctomycetota bacterium]|jgi:hypothetical protein
MVRPLIVASLLVLSSAAAGVQDPEPQTHATTCPESCAICEEAIHKALENLAGGQNPDGSYGGSTYYGGDFTSETSLVGLAFLAEGSTPEKGNYRKQLKGCLDYLLKYLPTPEWAERPTQGTWTYVNWGDAFSGLFLVEVCRKIKDEEAKGKIREILGDIAKRLAKHQLPQGGWSYGRNNRRYATKKAPEGDLSVMGLLIMWTLAEIRLEGVDVDPKMVEKGIDYMRRCTDAMGGVAYSLAQNAKPHGEEHYKDIPGTDPKEYTRQMRSTNWRTFRAAMAAVAWNRLGLAKDETAVKSVDLSVRYLPYMISHISWVGWEGLFTGLAYTQLGGDYPGAFRKHMRDRILARQEESGAFRSLSLSGSSNKSTAALVIALQAPLKKLTFSTLPRKKSRSY